MTKLLLATTNRDKLREIGPLLEGLPFEIVTLAAYPPLAAPEETGNTFEANARLKALYYAAMTGEISVAEDSGFEIDALKGEPGVLSARWGGAHASYPERFALLYKALEAKGVLDSPARFVCAIALVRKGKVIFETRGIVEGRVAREPRGDGGFGYDPVFFYPPFGRTLAESSDRKSEVSHRGHAFRALRAFLSK